MLKRCTKSVFAGLISAGLLASCGGGGGGGGGISNPLSPAGVSIINASNAPDAVAYAFSGQRDLGAQSRTTESLATGVSVGSQPVGATAATLLALYKGLAATPLNNLVTGVVTSRTVACAGGGSITAAANVLTSGSLNNGDSLSIAANSCAENGQLINGRLDFVFSDLTGTIGSTTAWSATLTITFSQFSVQSGGVTIIDTGDMTLAYSQTNAQVATESARGLSLQENLTKSDGTVITRTLTSYTFTDSVNGGTSTSSANFTLSGSSPKLGSVSFTVKTNTPFTVIGSADPSTGSMTVTAADKSSATLNVLDSATVRIDVDTNGDGVIDHTITTTWADLNSRI